MNGIFNVFFENCKMLKVCKDYVLYVFYSKVLEEWYGCSTKVRPRSHYDKAIKPFPIALYPYHTIPYHDYYVCIQYIGMYVYYTYYSVLLQVLVCLFAAYSILLYSFRDHTLFIMNMFDLIPFRNTTFVNL